jgi:Tol biopolymer transport system component
MKIIACDIKEANVSKPVLRAMLYISLLLISTACNVLPFTKVEHSISEQIDPKTVYGSLTTQEQSQIWSFSTEDSTVLEIFAVPHQTSIYSLDDRELALLDTFCSSLSDQCHMQDLSVGYTIDDLSLSPDKRYLAWLENASACIGAACFGHTNLFVWNTDGKSEPEILISQPYHIDISDKLTVESYTWSPDSKNIGYEVSSYVHGWAHIRVVELATKKVVNIGESVGRPLKWSPMGNRIAYITELDTGALSVSVTFLHDPARSTHSGQWSDITDFAWSPDGNWITVNGQRDQFALYRLQLTSDGQLKEENEAFTKEIYCSSILWSPSADWIACPTSKEEHGISNQIYLIDPTTGVPTEIRDQNFQGSQFINPQWSPEGKNLAFVASVNDLGNNRVLLIFNPDTNQFLTPLSGDDVGNIWKWDTTGESILLLRGNPSKPCIENKQSIAIFHWHDTTLKELSLGSLLEQELKQCNLHIDSIDW